MSFLIQYTATDDQGEIVHDETVVADVDPLEAISKDVWVLGRRVTLRIAFDPPLTAAVVREDFTEALREREAADFTQDRPPAWWVYERHGSWANAKLDAGGYDFPGSEGS